MRWRAIALSADILACAAPLASPWTTRCHPPSAMARVRVLQKDAHALVKQAEGSGVLK